MHHGKLLRLEQGISQHLPYVALESDDIMLTQQEDRLRIWKVKGMPVDTVDIHDLRLALSQRSSLFSRLPYAQEFRIYHTLLRSLQKPVSTPNITNEFAQTFLEKYYESFKSNPLYENEHYISLIHRLPAVQRKTAGSLFHRDNQAAYHARRQQACQHLEEASRFLEQHLTGYGVQRLSSNGQGIHNGLQFIARLLNWRKIPVRIQPMDIRNYISQVRLFFGEKVIEIYDAVTEQRRYAALLAIKGYASAETWPGMLDALLTLPIELCLTQSFSLIPTQQAREQLSLQQRRLVAAGDPDVRGFAQLQDALGSVVTGDYALGWHQLSVMIVSDDLALLDDQVATVHHELLQAGLIAVREKLLMEPVYWSQFPGNHQYLFRKITLHSGNMACLASLHTKATGNSPSYWGPPLLLLRTPQRSSYWFNFHIAGKDIGDTLILGEKGSGKTLLLTTLATAALQYKPRIFFFDKDFGAECWLHAMQANHIILGTGETAGLNPLQLPDTPSNRSFLHEWLRSLLESYGPPLTESEDTCVHQAIQHNYEHLTQEQRCLSHLQTALGMPGPGSLRNRLSHWHGDGEFAFYFDNPKDNLDLTNSVTGFEMHYLLQEGQAHARLPILLYLFYRIRLALEAGDKRPTLIILDEAWSLLAHEYFAREIKNWLLTLRKLNAITIFATQNPSDILQHAITPILVAETVTKIFYRPNTPTTRIYQEALHLTAGEYQALCQIPPSSRAFLVKQSDHAIVAQLDLQHLPGFIPILSTRPRQRQEILMQREQNKDTWWQDLIVQNSEENGYVKKNINS